MEPPRKKAGLQVDERRGGALQLDDDDDASRIQEPETTRSSAQSLWGVPSNEQWREWLDGRLTTGAFIGLDPKESAAELAARVGKLDTHITRLRGKGRAGNELLNKIDNDPSAGRRWRRLLETRDTADPRAAIVELDDADVRATHRRRLFEHVWGMVERDGVLDADERRQARKYAYERELGDADIEAAIDAARARRESVGETLRVIEEAQEALEPFIAMAMPRYGFSSEATSMAELQREILGDRGFAKTKKLLAASQISTWLETNIRRRGDDPQLQRWAGEATRAESAPDDPLAVWRFLWATGYPKLHLANGVTLAEVSDLCARASPTPALLESVIRGGELMAWCEDAVGDPELARFAQPGERSPIQTARAFLWAAGVDALAIHGTTVTSPAALRDLGMASQAGFQAIVDELATGRDIEDWLGGLAHRGVPDHVAAKHFSDARSDRTAARKTAYVLLLALGADGLVVFGRGGRTIVRDLDGLRSVARSDAEAVVPLVATGALEAWRGHESGTRLRRWYEQAEPSATRAAQYGLLFCGASEIVVGRYSVETGAELSAVYDENKYAVALALQDGALTDWLALASKRPETGVPPDLGSLIDEAPNLETAAALVAWSVGSRTLWVDDHAVRSAEELRAIADAAPRLVADLIESNLIRLYLRVLGLDDVAHLLSASIAGSSQLDPELLRAMAPSRLAELLGAEPAFLAALPPFIDASGIPAGRDGTATLTLANGAARGCLSVWMSAEPGAHVTVGVGAAAQPMLLAAGQYVSVPIQIAVASEAPPGTLDARVRVHTSAAEEHVVGIRVQRGIPWLKMAGELFAHVVVLASALAILRLFAGGVAEALFTRGASLARPSGPIESSFGLGLALATMVALPVVLLAWADPTSRSKIVESLPLVGCLSLVGYCLLSCIAGYAAVWCVRQVDGAAVALADGLSDATSAAQLAKIGWGLIGGMIGITTGTYQVLIRHFGYLAGGWALAGLGSIFLMILLLS